MIKSGTKARTEVCDNEWCKRSLNSVNINKSTQQNFQFGPLSVIDANFYKMNYVY